MISAEIIEVEADPSNGNIIIWVCFSDGGKEFVWDVVNPDKSVTRLVRKGRNVWPLLSGNHNFMSKTQAERAKWIQLNIPAFASVKAVH